MRRLVVGSSYLSDASVSRHDHHGSLVTFQCSIQEGETLDVEHVHFVDEQHPGHDLCSPLFSPLSHFLIYLFSHLWLDLPYVSSEQSQESLCSTVDDINLMQSDCVHYFLPLLQLPFWTLDKTSLRSHIIEVATSRERSAELRYLPRRFVNSNDVPCHYLLLLNSLNHLLTQIVHSLHLSCLQSYLPCL